MHFAQWTNHLPQLFQVEKGLVKYENQISLSSHADDEDNRTQSRRKVERYLKTLKTENSLPL